MYYCWHCYGRNSMPSGPCELCGAEIAASQEASSESLLIWGIRHPDPDVAIISTRRLAEHCGPAVVAALRDAIAAPPDPYVAADALQSLLAVSSVEVERSLLQQLAQEGSVMLRSAAVSALESASDRTHARRLTAAHTLPPQEDIIGFPPPP